MRLFAFFCLTAFAADPYTGIFQNENLRVEIGPGGAGYSGAVYIAGRTLPLTATAASGKLTGAIESAGRTFPFEAVRTGTALAFTADGVTSILQPVAPPPPFLGRWQSPNGLVEMLPDGAAVINGKPHRWAVDQDNLILSGNGEAVRFAQTLRGDTWTWTLPAGPFVLSRAQSHAPPGITGAWQGPTGAVQLNIDGTATVAGIPYRYTLSGDQLTLTGPDGTWTATVAQSGDTMTWNVNGKSLAFQRSTGLWALGGASGVHAIQPDLVGKWCAASNCYSLLADGSYLFNSETGTWTATADSLTVTAKKAAPRTLRLERKNHPQTGAPLLLLDGMEFAAAYPRTPWR